uniref:Nuclear receptor domain-containing protein n=1 Tax=Caenorhabditis tropicalis TaxID=1561998 RepID=A0A1I7TRU3_9PELO
MPSVYTEYVSTTCTSDMDCSDMPMYDNKDDAQYYDEEPSSGGSGSSGKKAGRKRANTTSSNGGNEKESKRTANKVCRVCGDKAFSYNFNVITCESCKAFFRRNANKEKEIRCPFNEQCEINMVSRRFCQRCRLTKCFSVGMKKEWIMSEEARLEKKQRVEENRERRLQDAINRALEEAHIDEDGENSFDDSPVPPNSQMSVRQYLTGEDSSNTSQQPQQSSNNMREELSPHMGLPYNAKDEKMMSNYYQDGPSDHGYTHDYDYSQPNISCASSCPNQMDPSGNCGATTIADNGASPSNTIVAALPAGVDADTKPPIPSNVLFSASMSAIQDVAGLCAPDVVNENLINVAQAAVQAQAIVNHTQQLAAAVVAQQVASQIGPVIPAVTPIDPLLAPALIAAPSLATPLAPITTPMTAPMAAISTPLVPPIAVPPIVTPMGQSLATSMPPPMAPPGLGIPIIPKEMPVSVTLLNQLEQTPAEMVTVPKDMLMKLIQNNSRATCSCTCACGRYPPGSCIVDEVTKDLLNGGSSNSSNAADRDETKLETTEDMQMNGLLPGESNSSIQWLCQQSSAQAVVDPITHSMSAEDVQTQRERRDSIFGAYSSADQTTVAQPKSVQEETFWEHTVAENESRELSDEEVEMMDELNEISNVWMGHGLDNLPILELFTSQNIESIVNGLKLLSSFRFLPKNDKRAIVKRGIYNYCVVKWLQHKESMSLEGLKPEVQKDFKELIHREEFNYRVQPGAFNTLAVSVLLHSSSEEVISTEVYMEHVLFRKLLDKNLPMKVSSDTVYNNYIPYIIKAGNHLKRITGGVSDRLIRSVVS